MKQPQINLNNNAQQSLALIKTYTLYRILLSAALLLTYSLSTSNPIVGSLNPQLFTAITSFYCFANIIVFIALLPRKKPLNSQQLFANFFIDILCITIMVDSSSGVTSGIGLLLVVIVAASSMMLRVQLALLTASMASLAILADTIRLINDKQLDVSSFLPTGLLGLVLFITAFLIQHLANRIRGAQQIAEQRGRDLSQLQSLNQSIVQRMRTGIIVINDNGLIQLANSAASELLADPKLNTIDNSSMVFLQPELMTQFRHWQQSPQFLSPTFRANDSSPELHASFSALSDNSSDTLIFLEDNRRLAQQAQQMKLASLGRLTASIAHEIRNPLGAISHAAQLLEESEQLTRADQRLCEIVKNHSKRMNGVIENVLQLSRRSAPNPEKVVLQDWLQQFIDEFDNIDHPQYSIRLLSGDAKNTQLVTVDTSQLNQVISNLAQNGLRYSKQHTGNASLLFYIHTNPNTQLTLLDIIDDGPGVADSDREKLFEPFYTTETKGSGLGLYISRELCEANEARLDYLWRQPLNSWGSPEKEKTDQAKSCFRISFPHPDRRIYPEQG
ncbi:MAG: two-component system sensor histidine kinase PilS (NtrC family) [Oceanicoccus sp.]|jgi:two-component system sensor histidine kinase PilS (NtrC family)